MKVSPQIKNRLKKSERYFKTCEILLKEGDYETCVSRVFYAVLYLIEVLLILKINNFPTRHADVMNLFEQNFIKTEIFPQKILRDFRDIFEKRLSADYNHDVLMTEKEAEKILKKGKKLANKIKVYLLKNGLITK